MNKPALKRSIKVALIVTGVIAIVAGGPPFAIIIVPLFALWGIYAVARFILTATKW